MAKDTIHSLPVTVVILTGLPQILNSIFPDFFKFFRPKTLKTTQNTREDSCTMAILSNNQKNSPYFGLAILRISKIFYQECCSLIKLNYTHSFSCGQTRDSFILNFTPEICATEKTQPYQLGPCYSSPNNMCIPA